MQRPRLLAYITARVDQELLLRNEYLAAENRMLRVKIQGRLQLSDGEKATLAKSPKSPTGWDAKRWRKLVWLQNPISFWVGSASWSRASLMARVSGHPWVGPESIK